jgi:hypothetical protein
MKSILLVQEEIDIVNNSFPDAIVEQKKSGMFMRCYLKEGTTDTDIYSIGRRVATIIACKQIQQSKIRI